MDQTQRKEHFALRKTRLCCSLDHFDTKLFFSLVDYRNNYYTSNDVNKIIEFYHSFENRDVLIKWMKERPNGVVNIHEVDGSKEIIVVIPTSDFNGKYAKECREKIFRGLHIIFVESGEIPDPYFNYARSSNAGIRKAMEYNPKWVVLSNDDVSSPLGPIRLINELTRLDNGKINVVFPMEGSQTATKYSLCRFSIFGLVIHFIIKNARLSKVFERKHGTFFLLTEMRKRFGNKYVVIRKDKKLINLLFFRNIHTYYNFESFGIFSSRIINKKVGVFDETYINAHEDQDFAILLNKKPQKIAWIDYSIYGIGGSSMGRGIQRRLRSLASDCYLNYRIEQGLLEDRVNSKTKM